MSIGSHPPVVTFPVGTTVVVTSPPINVWGEKPGPGSNQSAHVQTLYLNNTALVIGPPTTVTRKTYVGFQKVLTGQGKMGYAFMGHFTKAQEP